MDLIQLFSENEKEEEEQKNPQCVITDPISSLIPKHGDHFDIFFLFREDVKLHKPFGIFSTINSKEQIQKIAAEDVKIQSSWLWNENEFFMYKKDDVLKMELRNFEGKFYYGLQNHHEQSRFIPEWLWFNTNPKKIEDDDLGETYIVLPLKHSDVWALSDSAYAAYLGGAKMFEKTIGCIRATETVKEPFYRLNCGHSFCVLCQESQESNKKYDCMLCRQKGNKSIVKFRHGPCPIDMCETEKIEDGVVLEPCFCHLPCASLAGQMGGDQTEMLSKFSYCPYDACRRKISKISKIMCYEG